MSPRAAGLLFLLLASTTSGPARAEDPAPPATSTTARAAPGSSSAAVAEPAARLRASHRVDVIAPGERVESVIDRMRAGRTAATPPASDRAQPAAAGTLPPAGASPLRTAPAVRSPDRGSRPPGDDHGGSGAGPPGVPGPQPPTRGDGPLPDRHHR